jgi:hypothetical protein
MAVKQTVQLRFSTYKEGPEPRKVPMMVIVTYDSDGAALHHTISDNQNVNSEYYRKFLQNHLQPTEQRKQPHSSRGTPPLMMHKNAHCHVTRLGTGLLA